MNLLAIDFSTLAGVAAVNVFITEAIVKGCKVTKDWAKQLISWATPLLLSIVGLLCQFGLFADYGQITDWQAWIYTIVTGLGLGLVSNGLYDIPFVQQFLEWLVKLFNKKKVEPQVEVEFPIAKTVDKDTTAAGVYKVTKDVTKKEHDDIKAAVKEVINDSGDAKAPVKKTAVKKAPAKKAVKTEAKA